MTVSSIAEERRFNPRLQVRDQAEYVALMNGLKLDNPRLMDIAVPANRACGVKPHGATKVACHRWATTDQKRSSCHVMCRGDSHSRH